MTRMATRTPVGRSRAAQARTWKTSQSLSRDEIPLRPELGKASCGGGRFERQLKDDLIMLWTIEDRLSPAARRQMLHWLRAGRTESDDLGSEDMRAYAWWHLRVRGLCQRIEELREFSRRRRQKADAPEAG